MTREEKLIAIAKQFIGTKEVGNNGGETVVKFQKAAGGQANGEAWCAAFALYCCLQVDKNIKVKLTESCMNLWNSSPKSLRVANPEPGTIVIWQHYKDGKPTYQGHAGICIEALGNQKFATIEGNTSDGTGINREGDGVYLRTRSLLPSATFKLLGFLKPWGEETLVAEQVADAILPDDGTQIENYVMQKDSTSEIIKNLMFTFGI